MKDKGMRMMRLVHPDQKTTATYGYDPDDRDWFVDISRDGKQIDFYDSLAFVDNTIQGVLDLLVQNGFFTADELETARRMREGGPDGVLRARTVCDYLGSLPQATGDRSCTILKEVTISVHQQLDGPGFVVRVARADREPLKFPAETYEDALSLAESFRRMVEMGLIDKVLT